ncbi:response regulator transcription factor [Bifidobacterium aerophilum]|nr:response regulator transcription factor [Bifidobacterium aerophilum]
MKELQGCGSIAIVDNDKTVLWALGNALRSILPDCPVIWTADSGFTAIARARSVGSCPDLLLLDMSLGDINGPMVCREIRKQADRPAILAMTSFPLADYAQDAANAGAQGIVAKQGDFGELERAVRSILDERRGCYRTAGVNVDFQTSHEAFMRVRSEKESGVEALSVRESEVIRLSTEGCTSEQIAKRLDIAKATVDTLFQRACRKTGASNRVELAILWYKQYGRNR